VDNQEQYKNNIWKYYLTSVLGGFAFFYNAIDTLYYRHYGLSFEQVGLLLATGMAVSLLMEIPTGAFADLYGKKKSVIISSVFNLLGITCLALGNSFPIFLLGFAMWGISTAFSSGAGNAWLYDSLKAIGQEKTLTKHMGRLSSMFISVDILSSILAPLLFAVNVRLPYFVSWTAMIIVIIIQFSMYDKVTKIVTNGWNLFVENTNQIKNSIVAIKGNSYFLWLTFIGFIFFTSNKAISEIVSGPYLTDIAGYSVPTLSIILSGASIIQTITVFFTDRFENYLGLKKSLILLFLLFPLTIFLYSITRNNIITTTLIIGFYFSLVSFYEVVTEGNLSHSFPDDKRSTMLSINSMIIKTFALLFLPIFGYYVDHNSIQSGLWLLSGIILFVGIFTKKEFATIKKLKSY
jgi:MFS family permease